MKTRTQSTARAMSAFTMVEIALCLAIVGFALVAIIGVLPAGLNVQKDNREDTILNQDTSVWLDAIRAGGTGPSASAAYDDLTNYVDRIRIEHFYYADANPLTVPKPLPDTVGEVVIGSQTTLAITNGAMIVGLLSTPQIIRDDPRSANSGFYSNHVVAFVRSINGSATEKAPQSNPDVRGLAFGYRMAVEMIPHGAADLAFIQTNAIDRVLEQNLTDVRLYYRWPLQRPYDPKQPNDPAVGLSHLSFRTQLAGTVSNVSGFYYLQPRSFVAK